MPIWNILLSFWYSSQESWDHESTHGVENPLSHRWEDTTTDGEWALSICKERNLHLSEKILTHTKRERPSNPSMIMVLRAVSQQFKHLKKVAFQSKIAFSLHISPSLKSLFTWQNSIWQKLKCLKSGWERDRGVPFFVFLNLKMCTGEWLKGKRWRTRKSCCNYCSTLLTYCYALVLIHDWWWLGPLSCFLCCFSSFLIPFSFVRWYRWQPQLPASLMHSLLLFFP